MDHQICHLSHLSLPFYFYLWFSFSFLLISSKYQHFQTGHLQKEKVVISSVPQQACGEPGQVELTWHYSAFHESYLNI